MCGGLSERGDASTPSPMSEVTDVREGMEQGACTEVTGGEGRRGEGRRREGRGGEDMKGEEREYEGSEGEGRGCEGR